MKGQGVENPSLYNCISPAFLSTLQNIITSTRGRDGFTARFTEDMEDKNSSIVQ